MSAGQPFGSTKLLGFGAHRPSRWFLILAGFAAVLPASMLCAEGSYRDAIITAAVLLSATALIAIDISFETLLVAWFISTPVASYFIRVPADRSIITFDRAFFALLILLLIIKKNTGGADPPARTPGARFQFSITRFEAVWGLLSLAALASAVFRSRNTAYSTHMAVDAFCLPLVAFYVSRTRFDLSKRLSLLALAAVVLSLFLLATGLVEFVSGIDLFRYKGTDIIRDGELRVNGPFASDSSYSIICTMLFVFLVAFRTRVRAGFDRLGKLFYDSGIVGAMLASLLSAFRSVAVTLVACWLILRFANRRTQITAQNLKRTIFRKQVIFAGTVVLFLLVIAGWALALLPFSNRFTDPRTAFVRLATWRASATVAITYPFAGIGLGNYANYFRERRFYRDKWVQEVLEGRPADTPHSNPLWIAAELGLFALALYLASVVYLFLSGWRMRKKLVGSLERVAAGCFLALLAAYWIPGLTLASGQYADLNLYFYFLLGALSSSFPRSIPSP